MDTKKILLLGGSAQQIIAIKTAQRLGYNVVLCDFLEDNPGQNYANRFYLVSTTDKEAVLEVAKKEQISGVLAYASDPAAPTAAYVADKMGLIGNPYESVEILCNKDKFRNFLAEHEFCTPKAKSYSSVEEAFCDLKKGVYRFPVIVKPVDSSGSKGVGRINDTEDAKDKLQHAFLYSRNKKIIIEEYVEKYGYQVAGDGLSINGKLVFRCFGNDHFDLQCVNPYVPFSASFPYNMPAKIHDKIHKEIQRLLTFLDMQTATYNFDIRIDKDYNVYLMEVAPRNGGNYIPQVINYMTGIDLVEYSIRVAMGEPVEFPQNVDVKGYYAYYAVHSLKDGVLKEIKISPDVEKKHIIDNYIIVKSGDKIHAFTGANTTLGILIMRFESMEQMLDMVEHSEKWIQVILK